MVGLAMGEIVISNIDDDVLRGLRLKAELHGRTLEQEVNEILRQAAPLTVEQKKALAARARAMTPVGVKQTPSEILVREDRDDPDR
jgi:antitoxin FitA